MQGSSLDRSSRSTILSESRADSVLPMKGGDVSTATEQTRVDTRAANYDVRANPGFFNSVGTSLYGIGQTYYALGQSISGDTLGAQQTYAAAYNNSPFGQTRDDTGVYYYGTRGSLGIASAAAAAAG
jgi:hypothetical protein